VFRGIKKAWNDSALESAVEGVIREADRGNAHEVQRWFNMFKDKCEAQSKGAGKNPRDIEEEILQKLDPAKSARYVSIVERLSEPDGLLAEVMEWRRSNNLYV
jgi:hypothetical protein